MRMYWIVPLLILAGCQPASELETEQGYVPSTSAEGAAVYIISPEDGAVVPSGAVKIKFGLFGMGVAPATVKFDNTGHHHLLVNAEKLPPMNKPIPTDSAHIHFGQGQTETILDLIPGTYTLQLLLGDFAHIPHDPPIVSQPVTITVE